MATTHLLLKVGRSPQRRQRNLPPSGPSSCAGLTSLLPRRTLKSEVLIFGKGEDSASDHAICLCVPSCLQIASMTTPLSDIKRSGSPHSFWLFVGPLNLVTQRANEFGSTVTLLKLSTTNGGACWSRKGSRPAGIVGRVCLYIISGGGARRASSRPPTLG